MKTFAIYVTYNANIPLLKKSICSIFSQVEKIFIIDNTPDKDIRLSSLENEKLEITYLESNFGIAFAQNVGIKKALGGNADFIMLSDQDTYYPKDYINLMIDVFLTSTRVIATVPSFIDCNKKGEDGFIKVHPIIFKRFFPKTGLHEVMQSISSGMVIKTLYLDKVGLMNEELFIDWVDLEWCWRARKKKFKIIGNADVVINHQLGEKSKKLGFREINLRNHIRHYYITRNAFYLALYSNQLDLLHRITLLLKSFRYLIVYPLLSDSRLKNLNYVFLGFWHGITKKIGKLKND